MVEQRVIKFRAWHTVNKVMYSHKDIPVLLKNVQDDNVWKYMQYTGLKDKAGNEIYESDVVKCDGKQRTIKWANGKFWFVAEASNQHEDISEMFGKYYQRVEVVGNVYES